MAKEGRGERVHINASSSKTNSNLSRAFQATAVDTASNQDIEASELTMNMLSRQCQSNKAEEAKAGSLNFQ